MHRALLAVLVSALAVAAAGCGGARETLDPVAAAAENSASAGGYRVQMDMSVSAGGIAAKMTAAGAFDGEEGELTLDMTDILAQSGAPPGTSGEMRMLYLNEDGHLILYAKIPFLGGFLPDGKPWIRLDTEEAGGAFGGSFDELMNQSGSQNPAEMLSMLRSVGEVEEVGTEVLDGVETTHYRASVDLERAAEVQGASDEAAKRLLEVVPPGTVIPIDVWIGVDDDLPYRFEMAYDLTDNGEKASMAMTMTLTDWGSDVSVEAPPAGEVFDATAFAAQGSSGP